VKLTSSMIHFQIMQREIDWRREKKWIKKKKVRESHTLAPVEKYVSPCEYDTPLFPTYLEDESLEQIEVGVEMQEKDFVRAKQVERAPGEGNVAMWGRREDQERAGRLQRYWMKGHQSD
jgi:hypothetical protein